MYIFKISMFLFEKEIRSKRHSRTLQIKVFDPVANDASEEYSWENFIRIEKQQPEVHIHESQGV